jgi:hypothetical protein
MFLGKKSPIFNIKIMFFNIWAASWVKIPFPALIIQRNKFGARGLYI